MNSIIDRMCLGMESNGLMRTAEMVTDGHPDKFCDQVADAVLDAALAQDHHSRVAIECLAKDNLLVVSGELTTEADIDIEGIARFVYHDLIGYGPAEDLIVLQYVKEQSRDIAAGGGRPEDGGVDFGGAGDQGVMIGYATAETPELMPQEYVCARALCRRLRELRGELPWLGPDGKSQVTLSGGRVVSVVLAAQCHEDIPIAEVRATLREKVVEPIVGSDVPRVVINGCGSFTIGGPRADAGVVGRKIVVDAYGPRVPVGGGAYSGKDPTKVDRSAAYAARQIAKTVVMHGIAGAKECLVGLAYGIGQRRPEMITAITDNGRDLGDWVSEHFGDLRPECILERLGLRQPSGWSYRETAVFGHYGREEFPWERLSFE